MNRYTCKLSISMICPNAIKMCNFNTCASYYIGPKVSHFGKNLDLKKVFCAPDHICFQNKCLISNFLSNH